MRFWSDKNIAPLYRVCLVRPDGSLYELGTNYHFTTEDAADAKREFNAPEPQPVFVKGGVEKQWPGPVAKVCGLMWDYNECRWVIRKFRTANPGEFDSAPAQPVETNMVATLPY